jgi:lysophospholipase L1-like esterase
MAQDPSSSSQPLWRRRLAKAQCLGIHTGKKAVFSVGKLYRKYTTQHILLYTDSRGTNIHGHYDYKHYSTRLSERFFVDAYISPEKWTTLPDFLKLYRRISHRNYDYVILHAGIVDASPRHQKTLLHMIYPQKKEILDEVFGKVEIQAYLHGDMGYEYEGDKTNNLYSHEMAKIKLLPRIQKIPNLIWIGSNRIVPGWRGNYWKDRPVNISITEEYAKLFIEALPTKVDLLAWSLDEVQKLTFDNIHPNAAGSDYIYETLLKIMHQTGETTL